VKQQEARPAPCVRISGGLDGTERAVRCAVGRCASWDNLGSWENLRPPTGSRKRADGGGARVDVVARGREAVNGNRGLARTSSTPFVHREPTRAGGAWPCAEVHPQACTHAPSRRNLRECPRSSSERSRSRYAPKGARRVVHQQMLPQTATGEDQRRGRIHDRARRCASKGILGIKRVARNGKLTKMEARPEMAGCIIFEAAFERIAVVRYFPAKRSVYGSH